MATVRDVEAKILALEDVVVVIRAESDKVIGDYDYERKTPGNTSVSDWIEKRLKPAINGLDFSIISGEYSTPHGRTKMCTLRDGYEK